MRKRSALVLNKQLPSTKPVDKIQGLICNLLPKQVRTDVLEGRNHIVVPVVMLTEGVHHGSDGPMYYGPDELSKTPETWDHKPIVVYHPMMNGVGISACQPSVVNTRKVGMLMNTKYSKGRLTTEAWIESDRADKVDERIMAAITANEMMEVSTGVYTDFEETPGEWKGEVYKGLARNLRADHLALLPDQIGACSIADGAGLLRNSAGKVDDASKKNLTMHILRSLGLTDNEMSFDNIREVLCAALRKRFIPETTVAMANSPYLWVSDVYSNFVIYQFNDKQFRLGYSASDTGVELSTADPVEVQRVTEYRTVTGAKFVGNQGQAEPPALMDKVAVIAAILVANIGFTKDDRSTLEAMSDDQLKRLADAAEKQKQTPAPVVNKTPEPAPAPAPVVNAAPVVERQMTEAEYIAKAPPAFREVLMNGNQLLNEEKARLVKTIISNAANVFTEQDLNNRPLSELRGMAALAAPVQTAPAPYQSYYGQAPVANGGGAPEKVEALALPTMNFLIKK